VENSDAGDAEGQQHLGASAAGKIIVQGTGMDQDTLTRIFEPSFSTKSPSTERGLGLASVKSVVKRIGGHIQLESIPGVGTTFNVFLPRSHLGPRSGLMTHGRFFTNLGAQQVFPKVRFSPANEELGTEQLLLC